MRLKRLLLILGGMVVLATLLCVGGNLLSGSGNGNTPPPPAQMATPAVASVRARGEVVPATWADVAFTSPGTLVEWLVKEGDAVAAGAPLGRLDTTALERDVEQAELTLQQAQLKLDQLQRPADEAEVRQAQHAVDQAGNAVTVAQIAYDSVLSSTLLTAALVDARKAFTEAQHRYEFELGRYNEGAVSYWYVEQAKQVYDDKQLELARLQQQADSQMASTRGDLTRAQQDYQEAQDDLARVRTGETSDLAAARLDVESAQLALDEARAALAQATLVAPFAGTVVALHARPHDRVGSDAAAVTLADLAALRVETIDLDEWGAAKIEVGSRATVVVNAFDDKTLTGRVTGIGLRGTQPAQGDVVYAVTIDLDAPDPDLRWGMSVRITIPIE